MRRNIRQSRGSSRKMTSSSRTRSTTLKDTDTSFIARRKPYSHPASLSVMSSQYSHAPVLTSAEVHIGTPADLCRKWNNERRAKNEGDNKCEFYIIPVEGEKHARQFMCPPAYPEDVIDNLIFRYEEPNGMTRWDSPLFTVPYMDKTPDLDAIWEACLGRDVVVKPNQATVMVCSNVYFHPILGFCTNPIHLNRGRPQSPTIYMNSTRQHKRW